MTSSSRMLINESPLLVLPSLVMKIGLIEGVILQQIHFWLDINSKKKDAEKIAGHYWTYNTYKDWQEQMPWWSEPTIKKAILNMERWGILISKQLKAQSYDHTKYYSINYERLENLKNSDLTIEAFVIKYPIDRIPHIPSDEIQNIPSEDSGISDLKDTETTTETIPKTTNMECEEVSPPADLPDPAKMERERIVQSLQGAQPIMDHTGMNVIDLSKYPEDVRPVIGKVCQLWKLKPPQGKSRGYWIEGSRALGDACGEFGLDLLDEIHGEWLYQMERNHGLPTYMVSHPGALEKAALGMAGRKRQAGNISEGNSRPISSDDWYRVMARR